jgi:hypothetical protein
MEYIDYILKIGEFVLAVIGVIGGGVGIYYWKAYKKEKEANAQSASLDAKRKEAELVDDVLQRYEKSVLRRMDEGAAVTAKEFQELKSDVRDGLQDVREENRSQNEQIKTISELLQDMKEYLNGGFAEFENNKHAKSKTRKK